MKNKTKWQNQLIESIRSVDDLKKFTTHHIDELENSDFQIKVPQQFAKKIDPANPNDPILLQVNRKSHIPKLNFSTDPVGDQFSYKQKGMIHKYRNRLLLILTGQCAIHCQYCFRQNYPYNDAKIDFKFLNKIEEYILQNSDINEIILSGGDPLSFKNKQFAKLMSFIDNLNQIKITRIHSRFPVVIPERLDSEFLQILKFHQKPIVFVFHINHPNEIDDNFATQIKQLSDLKITLLNQSVLLAGINDSAAILISLSYKLFEMGILPYYLHQLDRVMGSESYEVDVKLGLKIVDEMRKNLPGYLVPKYVKELSGEPYKTLLV